MLVTRFVTVLVCFIFLTSQAFAQSYRCELKENAYNSVFSSMNHTISRKQKLSILKYYQPNIVIVTPEKLKIWKNMQIDITGGDREKSFQANTRSKTGQQNFAYDVTINQYSGDGNLYLTPLGFKNDFKRIGPIRYSCTSIGGSSYKKSSTSSPFQQEFNNLTSCNKKYVQQFLKGQNLYNGAIDGLWGSGTAEGLRRAKNLSAFKNLTTAKMFEKLRLNPICN